MSVGTALFGRLTGDCDAITDSAQIAAATVVTDLIDDRIIPLRALPKTTIPLIAYQTDTSNYDKNYNGPSGFSSHEVTVACVGNDYDEAEQLGNAVVTLLSLKKTAAAGTDNRYESWGSQNVNACFIDDVGDAEETAIEIDSRVFRKDIKITIWLAA